MVFIMDLLNLAVFRYCVELTGILSERNIYVGIF